MRRFRPVVLGLLFFVPIAGCSDGDDPAPSTPTAFPSSIPTGAPTATRTIVPSATKTATPPATRTSESTATSTAAPTGTPTAQPTPTPTIDAMTLAAEGEAAFFATLYGEREREQETISLLSAAVASDPSSGRSFFLLGMMHLYRASKNLTDYKHPSPFVLEEAAAALAALDRAVPLSPEDLRVPGFRAATTYLNGVIHQDQGRRDLGLQQLRAAVELYPNFNSFSLIGTVAPAVAADDPLFLEALALVRAALASGCTPDTMPTICGNAGKAPHNIQGAFVLFGDMFTKAGKPTEALTYYRLALIFPGSDTWRFRALAEDRIASAHERAALWSDEDPTNDPPFVGNGPEACVFCHYR